MKTHRAQLMAKLGAASAADLALLADERARNASRPGERRGTGKGWRAGPG